LSKPAFSYYDEHIETLPRPELERMQEGLILQLVPYVYARSPLIRQVWERAGISPKDIRSLADFKEKVPFSIRMRSAIFATRTMIRSAESNALR
jgi:phenylacetate-CoA ligase